jgi:hypothetical protein
MAYLETFLHGVTNRLSAAGVKALPEYALKLRPVPADTLFVTAAVGELRHEPPMPFAGGTAVPVSLTLRLRFHCRPEDGAEKLSIFWELTVLPLLLGMGLATASAVLGPPVYDRTLDRLVREAQVQIAAAVTQRPLPGSGTEVTA